jgi:BolA protein
VNTAERLRERLSALHPESLQILDQSGDHVGHAGAAAGGGHYRLTIVSEAFAGKTQLARHRLVYEAIGDMMHREVHALAIEARAPNEP